MIMVRHPGGVCHIFLVRSYWLRRVVVCTRGGREEGSGQLAGVRSPYQCGWMVAEAGRGLMRSIQHSQVCRSELWVDTEFQVRVQRGGV